VVNILMLKNKSKKNLRVLSSFLVKKMFSEDFVCRRNFEAFIKQRKIHERMEHGNFLDLLTTVHIETRTRCNSLCSFCAANPRFDQREDKYMSEETYHKIIDGLAEIKYRKRVSPYCNNEPLLDENIYSYIAYTRERLPDATIELKTNGTVLDEEKLNQLFDNGLGKLYINDYQFSSHVSEKLKNIYAKYKNLYNDKLIYSRSLYSDQVGRVNRAGSNPFQGSLSKPRKYFCYRPFEMAVFTVDGKMGSCSNDFYLENNMGNIHNASLRELFTGDRIQSLRRHLLEYDRTMSDACKKCDYAGLAKEYDYSCLFKFLLPFYL